MVANSEMSNTYPTALRLNKCGCFVKSSDFKISHLYILESMYHILQYKCTHILLKTCTKAQVVSFVITSICIYILLINCC